jgi:hypothetical protein
MSVAEMNRRGHRLILPVSNQSQKDWARDRVPAVSRNTSSVSFFPVTGARVAASPITKTHQQQSCSLLGSTVASRRWILNVILISSSVAASKIDRNISDSINIPVSLSKSEDGAAVIALLTVQRTLWDFGMAHGSEMGKQKVLSGCTGFVSTVGTRVWELLWVHPLGLSKSRNLFDCRSSVTAQSDGRSLSLFCRFDRDSPVGLTDGAPVAPAVGAAVGPNVGRWATDGAAVGSIVGAAVETSSAESKTRTRPALRKELIQTHDFRRQSR